MKRSAILSATVLSAAMLYSFCAVSAWGQSYSETILHSFCSTGGSNCTDGAQPSAGLIQASDGNFYGTTAGNGDSGGLYGTVFKITPSGSLTVLHTFSEALNDGFYPDAPLIEGTDGNFYGTTSSGGANQGGIVFKVTPGGTFTDIYDFCSDPNSDDSICKDGIAPETGLVQGTDGNFYGTTSEGGLSDEVNSGVIFKLTPAGKITVLHTFAGTDGGDPQGQLIQGTDGNLYGTTFVGGAHNAGTIFKITPAGVFTLLFSFDPDVNGAQPLSGLVQGANGNFYGSASEGGVGNFGTDFSITPGGAINLLYSFNSSSDNSSTPSGLVESSDGNFYGAGTGGGDSYPAGNIYELTPGGAITVVYSYGGNFDGNLPLAPPLQGSDGNFYGTTKAGGAIGGGIVYKLTVSPALAPPVQLTAPSSVAGGANFDISYLVANSYAGKVPGTLNFCFATNTAGDTMGWSGVLTGLPTTQKKSVTAPNSNGTYTYALTCGGMESGFATVTVSSSKKNSATVLTASPNPAAVGQTVTLTATVTGSSATPTGSVSYTVDGSAIGSGSLNGSGKATFAASSNGIAPGSYPVVATYGGNSTYNSSSSTAVTVKLNKASTATTMTASPTSVTPPATVTLTATVKRSGGTGAPTGSVTFAVGTATLATVKLNKSGVAVLAASTSGVAAGKYAVTAHYTGDASDLTSVSSAVTVTVK